MSLYRVFLVPPGVLTERRVNHGANGQPCYRHIEGKKCRCPSYSGSVLQVWVNTKNALEAREAVMAKYPKAVIDTILSGLPEQLTGRGWKARRMWLS